MGWIGADFERLIWLVEIDPLEGSPPRCFISVGSDQEADIGIGEAFGSGGVQHEPEWFNLILVPLALIVTSQCAMDDRRGDGEFADRRAV